MTISMLHSFTTHSRTPKKLLIQRPLNFALLGMSIVLLAGCGQTTTLQPKPVENATQLQKLQPNAMTQQTITAYRSIFVDNINRAKHGIEQLKQDTNIESADGSSSLIQFSQDDAGNRYDVAISALYADGKLADPVYHTLLDMSTFVPDVFQDKEINQRLQIHDPALARLVNQHLVWRQQQIALQQQVKENAQKQIQAKKQRDKEVNEQLKAFDETIANYNKQIATYQALVKDFQAKNVIKK